MRWLYRLQARFGLTGPEGAAALAVLLALTGGAVAQHLQAASRPLPPDVYAAQDQAFAQAAADTSGAEPGDAPLALFAAPDRPDAAAKPTATDSTASQLAEAAVETAAAPRRSGKAPPVRTNLNTATAEQLQRLPRIGPALAARIVEYRRVHGPFRHPDEIIGVKGIGEKTRETLRPWIHL